MLLGRRLITAFASLAILLAPMLPAEAQQRRLSLLRDAEAESLIRDYARPILKAAGISASSIQIKIVNDENFNAFVADSRHIFINSGVIMRSETPNELIGVLAHETGHLAGNHLARLREEIVKAQILSAIAMIGGVAAAAAGGGGDAGVAAALGGVQIGQRSVLAYQREQETIADRAALSYLENTGQSAAGMVRVFERLADQALFSGAGVDPYAQTHPMAAERLATIRDLAEKSPLYGALDPAKLQLRHDLVRAKFIGFTGNQSRIARAYPPTDTSLPAAYARAIATYRFGGPKEAVTAVDQLIKADPNNAYFEELKGQILLESGTPKAAIAPLQKAVKLAPKEGLIRVMLGHALVATDDSANLKAAVEALTKGIGDDPDNQIGYMQLAIAYARMGNGPMADLATAQGAFAAGDLEKAQQFAGRAQAKLKTGSPAWLRAEDIVTYKKPGQ